MGAEVVLHDGVNTLPVELRAEDLCAKMMEQFDLEIDCKTAFGKADNSCGITKHDFEKLLQPQQTPVDADGKRITSRRGGVQLPPPPPLPL